MTPGSYKNRNTYSQYNYLKELGVFCCGANFMIQSIVWYMICNIFNLSYDKDQNSPCTSVCHKNYNSFFNLWCICSYQYFHKVSFLLFWFSVGYPCSLVLKIFGEIVTWSSECLVFYSIWSPCEHFNSFNQKLLLGRSASLPWYNNIWIDTDDIKYVKNIAYQ